jgi:hypothetical protein
LGDPEAFVHIVLVVAILLGLVMLGGVALVLTEHLNEMERAERERERDERHPW